MNEIDQNGEPVTARGREGNGALIALLAAVALGVLVIDQLSKQWALAYLSETEAQPLLGNLISLQLTFNPGAAFGIAGGATWIFTIIAVFVIVAVLRIARTIDSLSWSVLLGMLLGGALGNLFDRLFRAPGFPEGHVVDFLNYGGFFIGNVADIAIVGAAIGIAILSLLGSSPAQSHAAPVDPGLEERNG